MSVLSPSSWHVTSCLCSAPFYQYTSCQLLISCYQNLLAKSSFECNYSSSSCCDVGVVFDNLQSGDSHWLEREMGQLSACKTQKHRLKRGKVCGEAVSFTGTVTVEKTATPTRHAAFLQVSIMTFFTIFREQECWVERVHGHTLLQLLSFQTPDCKPCWNLLLHMMRYISLPCCFSGTWHLGLCTK